MGRKSVWVLEQAILGTGTSTIAGNNLIQGSNLLNEGINSNSWEVKFDHLDTSCRRFRVVEEVVKPLSKNIQFHPYWWITCPYGTWWYTIR